MAEEINKPTIAQINYKYSRDVPTVYVNNVLLQRLEHEYVLSFFEGLPLIESRDVDAYRERIVNEGIDAECVARVVMTPTFLLKLAEILNQQIPPPSKEEIIRALEQLKGETESK